MNRIPLGVVGAAFTLDTVDNKLAGHYAGVAAVFDPDERILARYEHIFAEKKIYVFRDYKKFINCGIKAVVISSGSDRAGYAVKALRNKLDVLCEAPMALESSELDRIERAARSSSKSYVLAAYQCHRREVLFAEKLYRRGDIGKLLYAEGNELVEYSPDIPINILSAGSIGQVLTATRLRPTNIEISEVSSREIYLGVEDVKLSNGAILKAVNSNAALTSGMKLIGEWGTIEVLRGKVVLTDTSGVYPKITSFRPDGFMLDGMINGVEFARSSAIAGFAAKLLGSRKASERCIDLGRALDMSVAARKFAVLENKTAAEPFGLNIERKQ